MKTFTVQAAQGDLLIRSTDATPDPSKEKAPDDGKHVVAHSETGHNHFVKASEARFYGTADPMVCHLVVDGDYANLIHDRSFDTHLPIQITRGTWEIRRQREHTPEGWRRIED